jgi:hydroxymethylpyrimidine pyrophosphatase-like HAD family hydrolase
MSVLWISVHIQIIFLSAQDQCREYIDKQNQKNQFPIDPEQQRVLDQFNTALSELIEQPSNQRFGLIGSGLQFKFGQTTIARQDINHSISDADSESFAQAIEILVKAHDPEDKFFRIEDTGKDLEIILTVDSGETGLRDFDKGDGVRFLNDVIPLKLSDRSVLICGDTSSDVPMVTAAKQLTPNTAAVFVTTNQSLKEAVKQHCEMCFFVDEPDFLVSALNRIATKKK